jgi:hypothetical protein
MVRRLVRGARERLYGRFDCQTHIIALHDYGLLYYAVPKVANTSLKTIFSDIIVQSLDTEVVESLPADREDTELFRKSRRPIMYDRGILLCKHELNVTALTRALHSCGTPGIAWSRATRISSVRSTCFRGRSDEEPSRHCSVPACTPSK